MVVSSSLGAICEASARCQIRRYRRSSSGLSDPGQRIRVALERGRPDRLVGLLGALRLGLVDPALGHRERRPVALADDLAGLAHGHAGDRRRVGPHVGDEPDMAVRRVDALVQPLGDRHRPLRAVGQLAAGLLLERGRRERRRRRPLLGRTAILRTPGAPRPARRHGAAAVASSVTSSVSPSMRTSSAANVSPAAVARIASIVQYSRAVKASPRTARTAHRAAGPRSTRAAPLPRRQDGVERKRVGHRDAPPCRRLAGAPTAPSARPA